MEKNNEKPVEDIELLKKHIIELEALKTECEKARKIATEDKELGENIIDALRDPLIIMDAGLNLLSVNKSFYNTFKVGTEETLGKSIYDLGNKQWDIPKLRTLLEDILLYNASVDNYVVDHNFPGIGRRLMVLNARRIPRPPAKPRIILLVIGDITDIDRVRLIFEKMAEKQVFSNLVRDKAEVISNLKEELDSLRLKLGEMLKYNK